MLYRKYIGLLLLFFTIFISVQKVSAHAYLVSSNPSENEVLATAPQMVQLEFNEEVQKGFLSIEVRNAAGIRVDAGDSYVDSHNQRQVLVALKKKLPKDIYSIQWKVVSADGHQVSGDIPFSIGQPSVTKSGQKVPTDEKLPELDIVLERGLLYTGFALYAGFLLFRLGLYRKNELAANLLNRSNRMLTASLVLIGVSLLYSLPMETKTNANSSWADAFSPVLLKETLGSTIGGKIWIVQVVLFIFLLLFSYVNITRKRLNSFRVWWIPLSLFICLLATKAWLGHAYSSEYNLLTIPMDFLHLVTASIWIGGVISIAYLWRRDAAKDKEEYWQLVQRFTPWAMGAVIVLLFSGLFNGFLYVSDIQMLFQTTYGKVLCMKIILVVVVLVFGGLHHWKSRQKKTNTLGKSIKLQILLGMMIFVIIGILTNAPTPQVATKQPTPYKETVALESGYVVTLAITPNQPGKNVFHVEIKDKNEKMVEDIQQVTITIYDVSVAGEQKGSTFRVLEKSIGIFEGENLSINKVGSWHIQVHALTKDLTNIDAEFHIQ